MTGWILLAVYVIGVAVTARIYVMTSGEEIDEARFNGTIVGLIWPIALIFAIGLGLLALPTLGAKTATERRQRRFAAERAEAQRRKQLATQITELEAENERLRHAAGE